MPPIFRSAFAVIFGYMVLLLTRVLGVEFVRVTLGEQRLHPNFSPNIVIILIMCLAAMAGGYATAAVAERKPMDHAAAMGALQFLLAAIFYRSLHNTQPGWDVWVLEVVPPFFVLTGASYYRARPVDETARG